MEDVGNFLINETLRYVRSGFSPVKGEGKFQQLNKEYADEEKDILKALEDFYLNQNPVLNQIKRVLTKLEYCTDEMLKREEKKLYILHYLQKFKKFNKE